MSKPTFGAWLREQATTENSPHREAGERWANDEDAPRLHSVSGILKHLAGQPDWGTVQPSFDAAMKAWRELGAGESAGDRQTDTRPPDGQQIFQVPLNRDLAGWKVKRPVTVTWLRPVIDPDRPDGWRYELEQTAGILLNHSIESITLLVRVGYSTLQALVIPWHRICLGAAENVQVPAEYAFSAMTIVPPPADLAGQPDTLLDKAYEAGQTTLSQVAQAAPPPWAQQPSTVPAAPPVPTELAGDPDELLEHAERAVQRANQGLAAMRRQPAGAGPPGRTIDQEAERLAAAGAEPGIAEQLALIDAEAVDLVRGPAGEMVELTPRQSAGAEPQDSGLTFAHLAAAADRTATDPYQVDGGIIGEHGIFG